MFARTAVVLAMPLLAAAQGTGGPARPAICDSVGSDRCDIRKAIGIAGGLVNGSPIADIMQSPDLPALCGCFDVLAASAISDIYAEPSCRGEEPPPPLPPNNSTSSHNIHGSVTFPMEVPPPDMMGQFYDDFAHSMADVLPGVDPADIIVTSVSQGSVVVSYYIVIHHPALLNGITTALTDLQMVRVL